MTLRWTLTFLFMNNRLLKPMAGKRNQIATPQQDFVISLFEDGVNQRRIAEILRVSQSGVSKLLKRFNQRESCENELMVDQEKLMTAVTGRFYVV